MPLRRARLLAILSACLLGAPTVVAAQSEARVITQTEPGTPVVGVGVWISTAGVPDDPEEAGLAALSARSVFAPVHRRLDRQGAHLELDLRPDGVLFTLLAAPDHWEIALRELGLALFRDPPIDEVVVRERERLANEVRSRNPNPAVQAAMATDRAVYGEDHPWAHPPLGSPATLSRFTPDGVDAFLREIFRPERALFAVVGPVGEDEAAEVLAPYLSDSERPREVTPADPSPGVHEIEYPTITTWVTLVWPLDAGADLPATEVLAGAITDAIAFGPRSRSVYNARAWVVRRPGSAELRAEVVVPPAEAMLWTDRVRDVVEGHAGRGGTEAELFRVVRRHNGRLAVATARPEHRVRAAVERLLRPVDAEQLSPVTTERVRDAAAGLPDPVVVQVGPFRSAIEGEESD